MSTILMELKQAKTLDRIVKKSGEEIQEAFFANYIAALLMIRLKDLRSIKGLLKVKAKKSIKFSQKLHDINYWASCIFFQNFDEKSEKIIGKKLLASMKLNIQDSLEDKVIGLLKNIKMPEDQLPWKRTTDILDFLSKDLKLRSKYILKILPILCDWEDSSESKKSQAIGKCFKYLYQVDKDSKFYERLNDLSENFSINKNSKKKIVEITKLTEEEATIAANIGSGSSSIFGANVLSRLDSSDKKEDTNQKNKKLKGIFRVNGKIIKKRFRKFKPSFFQTK